MVGPPSYATDYDRDTKSEGTLVEDPTMPTPWEGEVHELRDRFTNPHPPRPRDYSPTNDYLRQLRGDVSEYRREPPREPNKVYATLCCGSKVGVVAWIAALLGLAIAIGLLLAKALKPDAFSSPTSSTYISQGAALATTATVTGSTSSIPISTLISSTLSTETETTVSTTVQTTVSTDSDTLTVTYTPPTTATETKTATQITTSVDTVTPPEAKTVTATHTPDPSTTRTTALSTSTVTATSKTTTSATITAHISAPERSSSTDDDVDDDDDQNDDSDDDENDPDDDDDDDVDDNSSSDGGKDKRMTLPYEIPLTAIQSMYDSATGSSKTSLSSVFASATSWCAAIRSADRDDEASSFCGSYPLRQGGGSGPMPSTTKAARKRHINVFARAAPLTEPAPTPSASSSSPTVEPGTITLTGIPLRHTGTPRSPIAFTQRTTYPHPPKPTAAPSPLQRRDKLQEPQVGTCTLYWGRMDCVASKAPCVATLLLIGIAVGLVLCVPLLFLCRMGWRKLTAKKDESSKW